MPGRRKGESKYEQMPVDEVIQELSTDSSQGLSWDEASQRLETYGENTIEEEEKNPVLVFLSHFWGPIPWMIEIAAILAAAVRHWEELGVIIVLLLINGGVSFWHEHKAANAIEALKQKLALEARVIRDGECQTIQAAQLVPGDIVELEIGHIVPSDIKLLEGQHLSIDESALTGESLPVSREGGDPAYTGTTVKQGEGRAVVTATGRNTRFARTVELIETAEEHSHFQRAVLRIGYFLIASAGFLVATIVIVTILRGDPWVDVMLFALGLTIAGIPVALPAVLSVTMSIGAGRLAEWKAIVSKLAAMEEMAGLEVLCADKTGTLTKNQLEMREPVLIEGGDKHELIVVAALTARQNADDPIDRAVLGGLEDQSELDDYEVTGLRPFDPTRKYADSDVQGKGYSFTAAKGAPQAILRLVHGDDNLKSKVSNKVDELGEQGFRSLGVAMKNGEGWKYLGLIPLLDPPREDSADVLRKSQEHGIDVRMVTGDHTAIGKQVAGLMGLGQDIRSASDVFREDEEGEGTSGQKERQISEEVLNADGFAEVTPEHKFKLIQQFQANDRIIGMTGDGVNDAPALKQADVGIAVCGATDAARSAADLVLTAQGLGVITRAVEEARRIFQRMISYATYRITETIRLLLFIAISVLAFDYYPVTPIMIVLLAILNDIPIIAIAWDNARAALQPVRWNMPRVLTVAAVLGLGGVGSSFLVFWFLRTQTGMADETIQTMIFLKLLVAGHMTIFLTRNEGWMWDKPYPSLSLFLALEGTQVAGTLVAVYGLIIEPVGWGYAAAIWGYAILWMLVLNSVKVLVYRKFLDRGAEESREASTQPA
ncbi:MAG: plasma-membrane proton-efflux P-type ATPase [Dehalococcoidia bacterium]